MTIFGFLLIFSIAAQAQPRRRSTSQNLSSRAQIRTEPEASRKNLVQIDAIPLLDKGFGMTIERAINPRLLIGPYFSYSKMEKVEGTSTFDLQSDVTIIGVAARYFITDRFDFGSLYLQAGIGGLRAVTDGVGRYNGAPLARAREEMTAFQYQAMLGYQFSGWELAESAKLMINLGVGASNGAMVNSSAALYSNGTMTMETAPKVSMLVAASLGVLF